MKVIKMTGTNCTTVCEGRSIDYLAVHYSAGTDCSPGKAKDLISWFRNPQADGSADYVVDEGDLYQYNPDPYNLYCHAVGGGRYNTKGGRLYGVASNKNCISLEIVSGNRTGKITYPNDPNYYFTDAVIAKAKKAVQYLMKLYKIDADHVIRHYDVNGKCCPGIIGWNADSGSETEWNAFHASIGGAEVHLYRVRLKWTLPDTQIGAYYILDNAKANCPAGYSVYDENGKLVWTNEAKGTQTMSLNGLTEEQKINAVAPLYQKVAKETGMLAGAGLTQFALESGYGTTDLAQNANNLHGMKCSLSGNTWPGSTWDGVSKYGKWTKEQDPYGNERSEYAYFRKYPCIEDSIADRAAYYLGAMNGNKRRYPGIENLKTSEEQIKAIKAGGYATDVNYVSKLMNILNRFNLTRFDVQTEPQKEESKQEETKVSKPKTIIDCMKIFQKRMRADIKAGKVWRYYNSHTSGSFDAAERDQNLRANCATIANWGFRKLKVFKAGNYFWGRLGGTLACDDATLAILKKNCKIIHVAGKKTVGQLIKDGTLQAGDIVTYMDIQHTNVYAGDGKWYDAGHAYCKESGEGAKFITWYGATVYSDQRVAYIIRYKGNATPEPKKQTVYRVQVGAYKTKEAADKRAAAVTKKTKGIIHEGKKVKDGYPCFVEGADWWRTFCGSFEDRNNAVIRQEELATVGLKKDKDTIIVEHQAK